MRTKKNSKTDRPARRLQIVQLLPLSKPQISKFAAEQGVSDPDALISDIEKRNAIEFAERPQDLIELCNDWRADNRISGHREQVASAIVAKLKPRTDRREPSELSPDRALAGARRLALAAIMMRRLTFRYSDESERNQSPGTAVDPTQILPDWTPQEHATLLQRPLFGFASYGRVRFQHRSVIEFLAAKQLGYYIELGRPVTTIKRLIFTETAQGKPIVQPTMRPLAAWLALEYGSIFEDVCARDPSVLLNYGDPAAMTVAQKERALLSFCKRYGRGGPRGMHVPSVQVHRFASRALSSTINASWSSAENPELRDLLLDIVTAAKASDCSDIAFDAVMSSSESRTVRLSGLRALIALEDSRLERISESLETDETLWPAEIARHAILQLFPKFLDVQQLLSILRRLPKKRDSSSHFIYYLPQLISQMAATDPQLEALWRGLAELVSEGVTYVASWPHYQSSRPYLLPALAAACTRQLPQQRLTSDLADAITLAVRLAAEELRADDHIKMLQERIASADTSARETLFWSEDRFHRTHQPRDDAFERLFVATHHGPIRLSAEKDGEWIIKTLSDHQRSFHDRSLMLEAALRHIWDGQGNWQDYANGLREIITDNSQLSLIVEQHLKIAGKNPRRDKKEARWERIRRQQERRSKKDHASWIMFWREIANHPDEVFGSDRASNTVWNLWTAMSRSGNESQETGWKRDFLEFNFGKEVADRMRETLCNVWRNDHPSLRSERDPSERNTFFTRWQLGLTAIAAEAEDPLWATKLNAQEASLACRYAPIQLNGLPNWLDDLARAWPAQVSEVLGNELTWELRQPAAVESSILTSVHSASSLVTSLLAPRIRAWIQEGGDKMLDFENGAAGDFKLNSAIDLLIKHDDPTAKPSLCELSIDRLNDGLASPSARIWLPVLVRLDPDIGIPFLESAFAELPVEKTNEAVKWIASLFGDRSMWRPTVAPTSGLKPDLLLRLVKLTYRYVRPEDDLHHEGAFSPNSRDHAQDARNAILGAVLEAKGPDGWTAKLELAEDPSFVHMRDRILAVASERAAQDADGEPMEAWDLLALERYGEAPPRTRDDMYQVVHDRIEALSDLLLQDVSPREEWAAISNERVMRRAISRQLKVAANSAYSVEQESVTGDENETDIRLRSTASDQQCVIELKLGNKKRSAADLREAISGQLVRKYMAADNCKSGFLLITLSKTRKWEHPDSGKVLDFVELIEMLNEETRKITDNLGGTLRLAARGLDLRPRLLAQ